jgi:hypothetical protein
VDVLKGERPAPRFRVGTSEPRQSGEWSAGAVMAPAGIEQDFIVKISSGLVPLPG